MKTPEDWIKMAPGSGLEPRTLFYSEIFKLITEIQRDARQELFTPYSFRLPKAGECDPHFGGNRTFWNHRILGENPDVRSVCVQIKGSKRGVRFIIYKSAVEWFEKAGERKENRAKERQGFKQFQNLAKQSSIAEALNKK